MTAWQASPASTAAPSHVQAASPFPPPGPLPPPPACLVDLVDDCLAGGDVGLHHVGPGGALEGGDEAHAGARLGHLQGEKGGQGAGQRQRQSSGRGKQAGESIRQGLEGCKAWWRVCPLPSPACPTFHHLHHPQPLPFPMPPQPARPPSPLCLAWPAIMA